MIRQRAAEHDRTRQHVVLNRQETTERLIRAYALRQIYEALGGSELGETDTDRRWQRANAEYTRYLRQLEPLEFDTDGDDRKDRESSSKSKRLRRR